MLMALFLFFLPKGLYCRLKFCVVCVQLHNMNNVSRRAIHFESFSFAFIFIETYRFQIMYISMRYCAVFTFIERQIIMRIIINSPGMYIYSTPYCWWLVKRKEAIIYWFGGGGENAVVICIFFFLAAI